MMKKLHNKVNIVPLIAKSDILTKQECKKLKDKVKFHYFVKHMIKPEHHALYPHAF